MYVPPSSNVGLEALAISVPAQTLDNDHWRRHHPGLVARAEERIWMWKAPEKPKDWSAGSERFNRAMARYVYDPFRGAKLRRRLDPDATGLSLEADAARQALDAAGVAPEDVDLLICTSFLPDEPGIGGAAFLARELGLRGAAWNLESACSSSLVALESARALIATGQYRRALLVASCTYSRVAPDDDPVSWGVGDAATAVLVGPAPAGAGVLGGHTIHSADTCGAVAYRLDLDAAGRPYHHLVVGREGARLLRETSEPYLRTCTENALRRAGIGLDEIDFLVVNTPLAWYADFCARTLEIDAERTISVYPLYANVGPALTGINLFHAAAWERVRPGDNVLVYSVGSVSSCSAAVLRWGDVALGAVPAGVTPELLAELEAEPLPGPPPAAQRTAC